MQAIACFMLELQAMCNTWSGAFCMCVGHDTNLTGSIPVAGIYRQAKRMASC